MTHTWRRFMTAGTLVLAVAALGAQEPARGQAEGAGREGRGRGRGATTGPTNPAQGTNWNVIQFPTQRAVPRDKEQKDPVKLFDNVYYVGDVSVSSYLITTSGGLVLIDTTFPETVDLVLDNVRKAGFDPANIKYVFGTHAAFDHYGGAGRIKQVVPGVKIAMSKEDWEVAEKDIPRLAAQPNSKVIPFTLDVALTDGQTITVGDTTFKVYVLPGRTPGSIGIEYPARDRGKTYRAFSTGAVGTPDAKWDQAMIDSLTRVKKLGPFQVWLPNHPFMALPMDVVDIEKALTTRGQGPHPGLVPAKVLNDQLDFMIELMRRKMAIEKYNGLL